MRRTAGVLTFCVLVAGCGVLPGTGGDDGTQVILEEPTLPAASPTPIEFGPGDPTPTVPDAPTPTEVPTATDFYFRTLRHELRRRMESVRA